MTKPPSFRGAVCGGTASVLLALVLVAGSAGAGLAVAGRAASRAAALHASDRQAEAASVAGMEDAVASGLLRQASSAVGSANLSDPAQLRDAGLAVSRQAVGAELIGASGATRASWWLTPPSDGGSTGLAPAGLALQSFAAGLAAGHAGLSSVLQAPGGASVVAVGVPAPAGGLVVVVPAAVFQSPLASVRMGKTGFAELVDAAGTVVSSTTGAGAGLHTVAPFSSARGLVGYREAGHPMVAATHPLAAGGWAVVVAQSRAEFASGTHAAGLGWAELVVVLGLLTGAALIGVAAVRGRRPVGDQVRPAASQQERLATTRELLAATGSVGMVCVRVDNTTELVDRLGHAVAEDVVVVVGRRLERAVSTAGLVARVAGDEFAIPVTAEADRRLPTDLMVLADHLERAAGGAVSVAGHTVHVSLSVGVAGCDSAGGDSAGDLLRRAHAAVRASDGVIGAAEDTIAQDTVMTSTTNTSVSLGPTGPLPAAP